MFGLHHQLPCGRIPKAPTSRAMTQFLVDTRTPGWSIARVNDFMGNEIVANVQMRFENVRVHKSMMITKLNGAYENLRSGLGSKSLHFAASLGECQRVWEEMRDYAKTRMQGGKPLILHPNIGQLIAEADVRLRGERLLQYRFAWECDQEKPGTLPDPLGFWYINYLHKVNALRLIEIGMEVYGGIGPTKELGFEQFVRVHRASSMGVRQGTSTLSRQLKCFRK